MIPCLHLCWRKDSQQRKNTFLLPDKENQEETSEVEHDLYFIVNSHEKKTNRFSNIASNRFNHGEYIFANI